VRDVAVGKGKEDNREHNEQSEKKKERKGRCDERVL
jgi:hypothetical protein